VETLLELKNVVKYFPVPAGGFIRKRYKTCKAVDDISFSVPKGSCFGIAGESGSGKSTLAKLILVSQSTADRFPGCWKLAFSANAHQRYRQRAAGSA
jgi:ABC-type oligopeptide transport system ATPase subunit